MKIFLLCVLTWLSCAAVLGDTSAGSTGSRCEPVTQTLAASKNNNRRVCGNNGIIYADRTSFDCAKRTNSRLRRISCSDSLILAKNALGNIRQQNSDGTLQVSSDRVRRLRERHEQLQRERNQHN